MASILERTSHHLHPQNRRLIQFSGWKPIEILQQHHPPSGHRLPYDTVDIYVAVLAILERDTDPNAHRDNTAALGDIR